MRAVALLAVAALLAAGCGRREAAPAKRQAELATVEVGAAPDAAASTAGDVVAAPPPAPGAVAGELPAGFPRDVPLPAGGGLVDFGPAAGGAWIELVVARPAAEVESAYRRRLESAGFRADGAGRYRRGALRIAVACERRGAGAAVRIEPLAP